jgi:hypothetical protein
MVLLISGCLEESNVEDTLSLGTLPIARQSLSDSGEIRAWEKVRETGSFPLELP